MPEPAFTGNGLGVDPELPTDTGSKGIGGFLQGLGDLASGLAVAFRKDPESRELGLKNLEVSEKRRVDQQRLGLEQERTNAETRAANRKAIAENFSRQMEVLKFLGQTAKEKGGLPQGSIATINNMHAALRETARLAGHDPSLADAMIQATLIQGLTPPKEAQESLQSAAEFVLTQLKGGIEPDNIKGQLAAIAKANPDIADGIAVISKALPESQAAWQRGKTENEIAGSEPLQIMLQGLGVDAPTAALFALGGGGGRNIALQLQPPGQLSPEEKTGLRGELDDITLARTALADVRSFVDPDTVALAGLINRNSGVVLNLPGGEELINFVGSLAKQAGLGEFSPETIQKAITAANAFDTAIERMKIFLTGKSAARLSNADRAAAQRIVALRDWGQTPKTVNENLDHLDRMMQDLLESRTQRLEGGNIVPSRPAKGAGAQPTGKKPPKLTAGPKPGGGTVRLLGDGRTEITHPDGRVEILPGRK